MKSRLLFLLIFVMCTAATAYAGESSVEKENENGDAKLTPCVKALVPSWIKLKKIVKAKGFVVELKGCNTAGQFTECAFSVANCTGRDAWLYLDKSSYLSDGKGSEYEPALKSLGGRSVKGNDMVRTFISSNDSDSGTLVFGTFPLDIKNVDVGVILTGGQWAGDVVKAVFRKILLNEKDKPQPVEEKEEKEKGKEPVGVQ